MKTEKTFRPGLFQFFGRKRRKKAYIAGKIGDLPIEVYTRKFLVAEDEVRKMGFAPVNPVSLPHNHGRTYWEYMREDVAEMLKCDVVYASRDWLDSPGAIKEVTIALDFRMKVIFQPL